MPDIYDELARATGFAYERGCWVKTNGEPWPITQHPYATIDDIDAEFRRRGWGWFKETFDVVAVTPGNPTVVLSRTDDTRHDLATLLLRCVQQCRDQGQAARVPAPLEGRVGEEAAPGGKTREK